MLFPPRNAAASFHQTNSLSPLETHTSKGTWTHTSYTLLYMIWCIIK